MDTVKKDKIQLSDLRKEKGLSQRGLSAELNLSPTMIGQYESGAKTPSLKRAEMISMYFGVPMGDISFANKG
jgi:transcriptional regulator with XRE-family HTH domain